MPNSQNRLKRNATNRGGYLGIPKPDAVRHEDVLSVLPHGKGVLNVVQGGLEIEGREGSGDVTIMANAAVIVKVDAG